MMGFGGDLLWTPVLRALYARNGKHVRLCDRPRLSDFLAGASYDRASERHVSLVFRNNPFVNFPFCPGKGAVSRLLDRMGESVIGFNRLRNRIESSLYAKTQQSGFQTLYLDLSQHSYVEKVEAGRYLWKPGGHIIDILAASVGLPSVAHECELFFTDNEDVPAKALVASIGSDRFITIEPATNAEFFGELRSWPFERWQEVVNRIRVTYPMLAVVHLGMPGTRPLDGCVNMCGKTDFRQAAQLIRRSILFLGTEGGLMHCANAVKTPALILWGGLTHPGFAAYPEKHKVIHHQVSCAPCGFLGHCPNSRKCMLSIMPTEIVSELDKLLSQLVPDLRRSQYDS